MKLIYKHTGGRVRVGDRVILGDGEEATVLGIIEPHKPSSTGRVQVRVAGPAFHPFNAQYFPCVIGARWVGRTDQYQGE